MQHAQHVHVPANAPAKPRWWWLSYADDNGPRAVVLIFAHSYVEAVRKAKWIGAPSECEIFGTPLPDDLVASYPAHLLDRVLTVAQAEQLGTQKFADFIEQSLALGGGLGEYKIS